MQNQIKPLIVSLRYEVDPMSRPILTFFKLHFFEIPFQIRR